MSKESLEQWIVSIAQGKQITLQPIKGDASQRKYYRVFLGVDSFILMDSQSDASLEQFIFIAKLLGQHGLRVPSILASNLNQGWLLLTDLGDKHYLDCLKAGKIEADDFYKEAIENLFYLQAVSRLPKTEVLGRQIPAFSQSLFFKQLSLFENWYVKQHLGLNLSPHQKQVMSKAGDLLWHVNQVQPHVLCHVDYHSRNLIYAPQQRIGIIDFQDAWFGPATYDLASLLNDCYIHWQRDQVEVWVKWYQQGIGGHIGQVDFDDLLYWFDLTALQRHLKNLGVFSRLCYRDGKSSYLKDMPRVINYILDICQRYPKLSELYQMMIELIPAEEQIISIHN